MNDNQFEALLASINNLTSAVSSLHRSINENANELHLNLQDIVASIDGSPKYLAERSDHDGQGLA